MKNITFENINEVRNLFSISKKVVVLCHKNPDGDTLGSGFGLYQWLENQGHKVDVMTPDFPPEFLRCIPNFEKLIIFSQNKEICRQKIFEAEIIFVIDHNAISRMGEIGDVISQPKGIKILIDHHECYFPENLFDFVLCKPEVCATAQIIFDFFRMFSEQKFIDKNVATALFTGILTDSISFTTATTTAETLQIAGILLSYGVEKNLIYESIYENFSENRLRLLGFALNEKMILDKEFHYGYISLTIKELEKYNYNIGDTEGFVNYPLTIKGIILSAFFTEKKDFIKISFRSRGNVDVNVFAHQYFNGGGHPSAAGGKYFGNLENAIERFKQLAPQLIQKI